MNIMFYHELRTQPQVLYLDTFCFYRSSRGVSSQSQKERPTDSPLLIAAELFLVALSMRKGRSPGVFASVHFENKITICRPVVRPGVGGLSTHARHLSCGILVEVQDGGGGDGDDDDDDCV